MKHVKLFEELINEIGDASAKPFKYKGPDRMEILGILDDAFLNREGVGFSDTIPFNWTFESDNTTYTVNVGCQVDMLVASDRKRQIYGTLGFFVSGKDDAEKERTTNFGEQYRVLATVCNIFVEFLNTVVEDYKIYKFYIIPKADTGEKVSADNKRGRFYKNYIQKQVKRIKKVKLRFGEVNTVQNGTQIQGFLIKE